MKAKTVVTQSASATEILKDVDEIHQLALSSDLPFPLGLPTEMKQLEASAYAGIKRIASRKVKIGLIGRCRDYLTEYSGFFNY